MAGKSEAIPCGHGSVDNCTAHLHVRETLLCGKLKREVIRMKYPGSSGVDVVIVPPSPRQSPPPGEEALLPKIKYRPLDLDIDLGEEAVFECVVADSTDICVSWSKNKNLLLNSGRYKIWSSDRSFFLKIGAVTMEDESLYEYVVRNKHGEVKGDVQLLVNEDDDEEDDDDDENDVSEEEEVISRKTKEFDLTDKPVFLRTLKHEYVVMEGHPLELIVETEGEPEVSWFYEGHKLKTTGNEFITIVSDKNTHSLMIGETVSDDEGFYECVAIYDGNIEISTSTEIYVEGNPTTENTSDLDFDMDVRPGSEDSNCHSDDASSTEEVIVSCFGISGKGKSDMNQIENRVKQLPVYIVSETYVDSGLPLMLPVKQGDRVELLTTKHGDTWLVRDAQAKSRIGFVSPTILVEETKGTG